MLGEAVYNLFRSISKTKATDIDVNATWLSYGDVRDFAGIRQSIVEFAPDVVLNLAALTDLEFCERNPEVTWLTNGLGAENLGLIATKLDVPYVYVSTAGVFDGGQETYHDFDTPNPLSVYAKSKYYGERFVLERVPKSFVVRAGWMMGGGPTKDKKFINKLYKQICAGTTDLHVVGDKLGTPTYTVDFALGIRRLLESEQYGLYNQVCRGNASRFDVAKEFVRTLGLEGRVRTHQVTSEYFARDYFAPRPASEQLVSLKLDTRGLNVMRDWRTCLQEYSAVFRDELASQTITNA